MTILIESSGYCNQTTLGYTERFRNNNLSDVFQFSIQSAKILLKIISGIQIAFETIW